LKPSIGEMIGAARGGRLTWIRLAVFSIAVTLALQIGFSITNAADFSYDHSPGIVGWAAVNDYPIHHETTLWIIAVFTVAASVIGSHPLHRVSRQRAGHLVLDHQRRGRKTLHCPRPGA